MSTNTLFFKFNYLIKGSAVFKLLYGLNNFSSTITLTRERKMNELQTTLLIAFKERALLLTPCDFIIKNTISFFFFR